MRPARPVWSFLLRRLLPVVPALAWSVTPVNAQNDPRRQLPPDKTLGAPTVYPVGDAIPVYRAVLDLFFVDGEDRPGVIVMHDTAEGRSNYACVLRCQEAWLHKSAIDLSTMVAFEKAFGPRRPRIATFGYPIPMVFLSWDDERKIREEGRKLLEQRHNTNHLPEDEWAAEFTRRYPGAWGFLRLSKVAFNDAHTEALLEAMYKCGPMCNSDEVLFVRKLGQQWTVVERIPNSAEGMLPTGTMRYRGPVGRYPGESEVLLSGGGRGSSVREGDDAVAVYQTVLDSLYSFHGEFPRRIVVTDWFPVDGGPPGLPKHVHSIQAATLNRYQAAREIRAPLYASLRLRAPVSVLPRDSMAALEQLGKPLQKAVIERSEMTETSPFWLEFVRHYPGAWGMVGFTRAAFNEDRTQALVFTSHACGDNCRTQDTWLLERSGDTWHIVERIPRYGDKSWMIDPLRYLGADADPNAYRKRRVQGVMVSKATGRPLPLLRFTVHSGRDSLFIASDSNGRYQLANLPIFGGVVLTVPCQRQPMLTGPANKYSKRQLLVAEFPFHPGLDSTVNIPVDLRRCLVGRRAEPLVGAKPSPKALASGYPDATDAAVYRGVLDELYPDTRKLVLLFPYAHFLFDSDFNSELARLEREAVIDSTVAPRLRMLPEDSAWLRPDVAWGHRVHVLAPSEQAFLEEQASEFAEMGEKRDLSLTGMAKEAYPGADKILSLSRIAYNQSLTQAVVQVGAGSPEPWHAGETMILHKIGARWRVVRRHVEKEETSGEMIAGRCEPVAAAPGVPSVSQLERFVGEAEITLVPGSTEYRGSGVTRRYRFIPNDTLHRYYWLPMKGDNRPPKRLQGGEQRFARLQALDSTGKVVNNRGELVGSPRRAAIIFAGSANVPEGMVELDGPYDELTILRVSGREFVGRWLYQTGPTYPAKGYFCGRLR